MGSKAIKSSKLDGWSFSSSFFRIISIIRGVRTIAS